jgi:glycosyltransferase involved in cell wall biosynthesis
MTELRVIHVVASLAEASGGPPRSVIGLCEHLASMGCRVEIVTLDTHRYFGAGVPLDESRVKVHRVPSRFIRPLRVFLAPRFPKTLQAVAEGADVIHSHGLWLSLNDAAARVSREFNLPHVISVRGNLHAASLASSRLKKTIARRAYVDRNLRRARCLHATAAAEVKEIRSLGFTNPIALLPTGITLPRYTKRELQVRYFKKCPAFTGKRVLLFLGRLHPHKGIFYLAEAWKQVSHHWPDWHLVVAGPNEVGCQKNVEALLASGGASGSFSFIGAVSGVDKWALLANCELLVLPTRSENFGHAIAEALAAGRPVLTTDTTPWNDLEEYGCGWRIPVGAEPLKQKLTEVLKAPSAELEAMGENAKRLVSARYDWNRIAQEMLAVYEWLMNRRSRPACVESATL